MKYLVLEIQVSANGSVAMLPVKDFDDRNTADSAYFSVLSFAAVSNVYKHTALVINEEGEVLLKRTYTHENINS